MSRWIGKGSPGADDIGAAKCKTALGGAGGRWKTGWDGGGNRGWPREDRGGCGINPPASESVAPLTNEELAQFIGSCQTGPTIGANIDGGGSGGGGDGNDGCSDCTGAGGTSCWLSDPCCSSSLTLLLSDHSELVSELMSGWLARIEIRALFFRSPAGRGGTVSIRSHLKLWNLFGRSGFCGGVGSVSFEKLFFSVVVACHHKPYHYKTFWPQKQ